MRYGGRSSSDSGSSDYSGQPSTSRTQGKHPATAESQAALEVSVQLSRFHLETLEASATGDVDVRGLCIGIGGRELLTDSHLALRSGVRYGLIGCNGVGKSSLLRACATRSIPGFPRDMKVLYVQQDTVAGDGRSPLQTLLDEGSPRGALAAQISALEAALEGAGEGEEEEGDDGNDGHGSNDGVAGRPSAAAAEEEEAEDEEMGDGGGLESNSSNDGAGGGSSGDGEEAGGARRRRRRRPSGGGGGGVGRERGLVAVVRSILASRAASVAEEAEQTAARRSRARGKEALRAAREARDAARRAEAGPPLSPASAASLAPQLLAELYEAVDALGGSEEEEAMAAGAILEGLGFSPEGARSGTTRQLSGGWRMRVALGVALLSRPHLLLLDEPTNHLDIQSILWLQDYLSNRCPGTTVLLVSHDAAFLNAVTQETIVMRDGRLTYFPGTYDAYLQARAEASLHQERQVAGQERQRAHLQDTIARAERAAREAGDDKRLLQAASRRKKLDRVGAEKTADGKRFKVSYWAGWHETLRPQVELDRPEEPVVLQLPPPEPLRQRGPLLQLRDVTVAYGTPRGPAAAAAAAAVPPPRPQQRQPASKIRAAAGSGSGSGKAKAAAAATAAPARPAPPLALWPGVVLTGVTMDIEQGARIGLLGLNGSGKSSLLRVLAGDLAPAAGELASPCPRLAVGCLDQHSGRRLVRQALAGAGAAERGAGAEPPTAFSVVQARAPHLKPQEVYDYLGKFAVPGPVASTPLAALSGGQRCRVALGVVMLARPHVLLLDEPTNHLDLLTVQALAAAVREWEGAVVVASHDLRFLADTCREVWVVEGGAASRQPQPEPADAIRAYADRLMERLRRRRGGGARRGS